MNDTSTKRAEEIAYNLQLSGVSGSTWRATEVEASNMLRALAAENEKLRAALRQIGKGDICVALLSHPPMCSRAFAARAALGEKK